MISINDLCDGNRYCVHCLPAGVECVLPCDACPHARCDCGLPWDAGRGPHTRSGIRLSHEAVTRVRAREAERLEVEARRERERRKIEDSKRLVFGGGR